MKIREKCYDGSFSESPLSIVDESAAGYPTENYRDTHTRPLTSEKMKNMVTMYDKFIPPERRPDYLPPFHPLASTSSQGLVSNPSSSTTTGRKKSQCQTPGCDGTGHRNKSRWNEGHTTRAGCPRV